jgi:hypothetical protein
MSLAPYLAQTTSPELVRVCFRFQINGTSDPDALYPGYQGVTDVARVSAGVFDITFADKWPALVGLTGTVLEATPAHDLAIKAALAGYDSSTGILRITVYGADGSTAAEDPVDNDWVYLEVTFARRNALQASVSI